MQNAKQITDDLIYRMKNTEMQWFEIKREVEPNWLPNGTVPFDVKASKGVATFSVYASSLQDAEDQVSRYLERDQDE